MSEALEIFIYLLVNHVVMRLKNISNRTCCKIFLKRLSFHLEAVILTKYVNIYDGDKLILRDKIGFKDENHNKLIKTK